MVEIFDRYYGRDSVIQLDAGYTAEPTSAKTYPPRQPVQQVVSYGGFEITLTRGEQVCGTQTILSEQAGR